jgi:hypothetical protein
MERHHLTQHALHRIRSDERTVLFEDEILEILAEELYVIEHEFSQTTGLLFYSFEDAAWFVLIQTNSDKAIKTVLPLHMYRRSVSAEKLAQAKSMMELTVRVIAKMKHVTGTRAGSTFDLGIGTLTSRIRAKNLETWANDPCSRTELYNFLTPYLSPKVACVGLRLRTTKTRNISKEVEIPWIKLETE